MPKQRVQRKNEINDQKENESGQRSRLKTLFNNVSLHFRSLIFYKLQSNVRKNKTKVLKVRLFPTKISYKRYRPISIIHDKTNGNDIATFDKKIEETVA